MLRKNTIAGQNKNILHAEMRSDLLTKTTSIEGENLNESLGNIQGTIWRNKNFGEFCIAHN